MTTLKDNVQRVRYLARCLIDRFRDECTRCPCCGSTSASAIKSKRFVTKLVRCRGCQLLFRIPQDRPNFNNEFYQEEYESGFTTTCPSENDLREMLARHFRGTGKNITDKVEVLRALGVASQARILDFGASWGYSTWQLREAGFQAEGFEVSRPRAEYGRQKLAVPIADKLSDLRGPFDVFFSIHVLEHLPSPTMAFDLATSVLRPGGLFVAYTPNGSSDCMRANPKLYHKSWGRLHPLYLDDVYYCHQLPDLPKLLVSSKYGAQVDIRQLKEWDRKNDRVLDLTNGDLLAVVIF